MSGFAAASGCAWLGVTAMAGLLRGPRFAVAAAILVGVYTLSALTVAPLVEPTRLWPAFGVLHALAYLQLLLLARPRMRGLPMLALVFLPGSFFLSGTMLSLPWGIARLLGAPISFLSYSVWIPYALSVIGLYQSLTARREEVHITLGDGDAGPLARRPKAAPASAHTARPLRVVQISDPHLGPFMSVKRLQSICADAATVDPDLVLLTGDFLTMDSQQTAAHLAEALAPLRPLAGRTFACRGNHDLETPELVAAALTACGVRLLTDEAVTAQTPWGEVDLLGFDFVFERRAAHVAAIAARYAPRAGVLRIALLHDPGAFKHVPPGTADLVLSGHTHGGQLGLLSLGGQWTVPRLIQMPDHGLWARGRDRLYVHRGNGHYGFPLRIGVPAEESILYLHYPARPVPPPRGSEPDGAA